MQVSSGADLQLTALKASVLVKGREMGLGQWVDNIQTRSSSLGKDSGFLAYEQVMWFCDHELGTPTSKPSVVPTTGPWPSHRRVWQSVIIIYFLNQRRPQKPSTCYDWELNRQPFSSHGNWTQQLTSRTESVCVCSARLCIKRSA